MGMADSIDTPTKRQFSHFADWFVDELLPEPIYSSDSSSDDYPTHPDRDRLANGHGDSKAPGNHENGKPRANVTGKVDKNVKPVKVAVAATTGLGFPSLTLDLSGLSFKELNRKMNQLFRARRDAIRLFTWYNPVHTLSFLAAYTYICVNPYMLLALPLFGLIIYILIPAYLEKNKPPQAEYPLPARPPIRPADLARRHHDDFFRNMRELREMLHSLAKGHDLMVNTIAPMLDFSDQQVSSLVFCATLGLMLAACFGAHLVPWRHLFLSLGWTGVFAGNPTLQRWVKMAIPAQLKAKLEKKVAASDGSSKPKPVAVKPPEVVFSENVKAIAHADFKSENLRDTSVITIFELQRKELSVPKPLREFQPWIYSLSAWEPYCKSRMDGEERPPGTRFLEDVTPPSGWEFAVGSRWLLDVEPEDWVARLKIDGVEVEIEGDGWVTDIDADGRADGEWRRRKWLRVVRRYIDD